MGRYLDTKEHKDWRLRLIARDKGCVLCGSTERISGHHLLPKEIEKFRSEDLNGICLCGRHHAQYGKMISPHNDSAIVFALWLSIHRPEQWKFLQENWELVL